MPKNMKRILLTTLMVAFCADLYAQPAQEIAAEKTTPTAVTGTEADESQKTDKKPTNEKALNNWLNKGGPDFSDKMNANTDNLPLNRF